MKKNFIVILIVFFGIHVNAQNKNLRGVKPSSYFSYAVGEIIFFPYSEFENRPDSVLDFCETFARLYFLNGLQLSEETFCNIGLKSKDVIKGEGKYSFNYQEGDTSKCIKNAKMSVTSILPILLNGIELGKSDHVPKISQINSNDIVTVIRKSSLFRKTKIEIITK